MTKSLCHIGGGRHRLNRYDHLDRRVQKITPEAAHTFFYDGWLLTKEIVANTNGTTDVIEYHWGKDLSGTIGGAGGVGGLLYLAISNSSTPNSSTRQLYIPFYDAYGNVMGYWDAQGNVVAEYTYDAFGKLISSSGPMADVFSFRYSTKYFDVETGFYYYGYRFYSPELKRWITRDPIGEEGGVNLYVYCENASTHLFDPNGLTKYWDNYLNLSDYPHSPDVWEKVGGRLFWSFLTIAGYYNSCAIRVSRSLILSGHVISAKVGREKNYDIKATYDAEREGKSAKNGQLIKAESPNARFVINARNVGTLLDELLTDPTVKKDSWSTVDEALRKAECIRKEDGEAFFADEGHAGMIKRGYVDKYFPQKSKGRIWRIK